MASSLELIVATGSMKSDDASLLASQRREDEMLQLLSLAF